MRNPFIVLFLLLIGMQSLFAVTEGQGKGDKFVNNTFEMTTNGYIRVSTTTYTRYYHIPLGSFNPGASGATWTAGNSNTVGGWQLDADAELLEGQVDIHSDWCGDEDMQIDIYFEVNVDNTGGNAGDTVDIKVVLYYKGLTDVTTKTQTQTLVTTVGQSARYKLFKVSMIIDYDVESNVIETGDILMMQLNLVTASSEVDNIIVNNATFDYPTTHIGIEDGDI